MQVLEFDFDWQAGESIQASELASTCASLRIQINNSILTRVVDHCDNRVREFIHVPLYPLAEWLATNWWTLIHESEYRTGLDNPSFLERHAIAPSSEGYRYPNMQVVSFDTRTRVTWEHERLQWTDLEFLEREGCEWIDKERFIEACASLVDDVIARLMACDITNTLLQEEWETIQRADPEEQKFCRTAATLGLDPYSIDGVRQSEVILLEETLSGAVLEEALPVISAERLETELVAIQRVLRVGKANTIPLNRLTALRSEIDVTANDEAHDPPWMLGYNLARNVRTQLDLDGMPLASWPALGQALGERRIEDGRLSRSKAFSQSRLLNGVVTSSDEGLPAFAFRPGGTSQTCRFRFCRGLAELLLAPGSDALLTSARSNRQQRGRAFAAEFLAPSNSLREELHQSVLDEDEIEDLASRFGVSQWVIEHQVKNHGIARIKHENLRDESWIQ